MVTAATHTRFIIPPTNSRPIRTKQQPRQLLPFSIPMTNGLAPLPQPFMMSSSGFRQRVRKTFVIGVHW